MKPPGQACVLVSISSDFIGPVKIGDCITALAQVISNNTETRTVELSLTFTNQRDEPVATGTARVKPRKA